MDYTQQRKIFLIGAIVVTGALVSLFVWLLLKGGSATNEVIVNIVVAPKDSKLTIDGQPTSAGRVALTKGKHTLKATRQFFEDAVKEIDTQTIKPDETIYLTPKATSDEALNYLVNHPEDQLLREQVSGAEFSKSQEQILENNPIVSSLPYETLDYKIDYTIDENKNASFQVTLYPAAAQPGTAEYKQQLDEFKQAALAYLESKGLDTSKADITFTPNPDDN